MRRINCLYCKIEFKPKVPWQKFCGKSRILVVGGEKIKKEKYCRQAHWIKNHPEYWLPYIARWMYAYRLKDFAPTEKEKQKLLDEFEEDMKELDRKALKRL